MGERRDKQRVLRIALTVVAVALGVVAVWLIVTSDNAQRTKVGALAGFWALLIAAYPALGFRHPNHGSAAAGQELDVRAPGHVERMDDAMARMEYERRLQMMVRHEIQTALGSELANLRSEVAALRSEILEKVGGQIRLERIETTRMIGSDIEALQQELRQLKMASRADEPTVLEAGDLVQSMDDAVARQLAAAEAEHAARLQHIAQMTAMADAAPSEVAPTVEPEPVVTPEPAVEPEPVAQQPQPVAPQQPPVVERHPVIRPHIARQPEPVAAAAHPQPEPEPEVAPEPAYAAHGDPFAAMPRLSPFESLDVDDEQDEHADRPRHSGEGPVLPGGRHASGEADWATARPGSGRRHREENGVDILADILRRHGLRS